MANDDLLHQLDILIQKRLEENNKQQDESFQKRLDAAVDPIHERLDTQYKNLTSQINTIEKNLRLEIKESEKNILEQVKPLANLIVDHDTQIEELQKAVGLRPKH
jgi:hypothetical protein